jgi:hypothetical protein
MYIINKLPHSTYEIVADKVKLRSEVNTWHWSQTEQKTTPVSIKLGTMEVETMNQRGVKQAWEMEETQVT